LGCPPLPPSSPFPPGLHTPTASTKQEGPNTPGGPVLPHLLAKVKENLENFRKKIPYFSETLKL